VRNTGEKSPTTPHTLGSSQAKFRFGGTPEDGPAAD
jgi:hypothetical protein